MATLNGGISADTELIRVSGTLPEPGTYFTLDDEAFKANGAARGAQGRNFTRDYLAVDRGVAGTTKATHSNGANLTPYYPDAPGGTGSGGVTVTGSQGGSVAATTIQMPGLVVDQGGGVAGVSLVWSRLGPFTLNFDTPGLLNPNDNGPLVTTVPEGAMFCVVPFIHTVWDQDCSLQFNAGVDSDNANTTCGKFRPHNTGSFDQANAAIQLVPEGSSAGQLVANTVHFVYAFHELGIFASLFDDADPPTAGAVDVYVLVASPAS